MRVKVWLKAFRLRTLPLALSCILMGAFLAAFKNAFHWPVFLLCVLTTVFLQVLSNLSNDYGDSVHGADSDHRTGPKRTVQAGEISPSAMKTAMIVCAVLAFVSGLSLLFIAFGPDWRAILFFVILGIASIVAAVAYTVGKRPYGYAGLGDVSVLIFFGLVGVLGSLYLFTKAFGYREILPAISCGLFSVGVLNVNNIRDIDSDRMAGKNSIPVRLGKSKAVMYHWVLLSTGFVAALAFTWINYASPWQLIFLLSLPLFLKNAIAVKRYSSVRLDPYLKQMALSTLIFVVLFGIGLLIG
jgi:1,4-dihydroxy-2-naphthoate polyprenyltransferase